MVLVCSAQARLELSTRFGFPPAISVHQHKRECAGVCESVRECARVCESVRE